MNTSYLNVEKLYCNTHNVDIFSENGLTESRTVLININKQQHCLEVKLRDQNDFSFNFTTNIDWNSFEKMKVEQYLEICFEEFHLHFIELLKQTTLKEMLLKLETRTTTCKMVFYERSKIKSLIFLIIDLMLTDQKNVISEMAQNINQLKDLNRSINSQLLMTRNQLNEKEILLSTALSTTEHLKTKFVESIKLIENSSTESLEKIQTYICYRVNNLNKKFDKLMKEVDAVKKESRFRENTYAQTIFQLEQFKRDNEKNYKIIDSMKVEIDILNSQKKQNEAIMVDLKQNVTRKNKNIEDFHGQITELRKDIQEATIIIAQKTKTHDEIAKDLVQANTMLVNFNKQYDIMAKEMDHLRDVIKNRDQTIEEQNLHLRRLSEDFSKYKRECSVEDMNALQLELRKSREKIEELEKCNREAAKINGLLTKKLAHGDTFESRNMNFAHSK